MKMEPRIGLLGICENRKWWRNVSDSEWQRSAVASQPVARPLVEIAALYRLPGIAGERQEEMYIVQGEEAQPEYLVGDEEVPDVRSAESRTGGAVTVDVEWPRIGAELGALDVESAVPGKDRSVPAHPGGCDAINEVDTAAYRLDEIFREAHAHQIPGVRFRESVIHHLDHLVHRFLFFSD